MTRRQALAGLVLLVACLGAVALISRALHPHELRMQVQGSTLLFTAPRALAWLACWPLLVWALGVSLVEQSRLRALASLTLRSAVLTCLVLALARPSRIEPTRDVSVAVLLDISSSIHDEGLAAEQAILRELESQRGERSIRVIPFARRPLASLPLASANVELPGSREQLGSELAGTDIAAALRLGVIALEPGTLGRVLVVSDGELSHGDLLAEASRAASLGVRLFHRTLDAGLPPEVAIESVDLPATVQLGESFEVRVGARATRPTRARLRLFQGAVLNGLDGIRELDLPAGHTFVRFTSIARVPGRATYRAVIEPLGPDRFAENNHASALTTAVGRPSVLIVDSEPERVQAFAQALQVADFEVELRSPSALPRTLAELVRFDFVILSDVPSESVSAESVQAIERYVRDVGGGFMMAGGEHSFGLGGYRGTRMESLLPVTMDSQRRRDEYSLALALVIDCSGSMSGAKMELAKEAARATAELLGADDSIGVIGFSGQPERRVRMQSAANRLRIAQDIARLSAQGGTAIYPALEAALADLLGVRAQLKHVILLTDGQTQEAGIPELTRTLRAEGITITTIGLGTDVNRSLLQSVASVGGGRAYFTADPENVPRIFMRETNTVTQNSIVEELTAARPVEPADFLRGVDMQGAPLLRGYVSTQARARPAQVLLASERGEPLLARWHVGLGWVLALTTDLKPRWSVEWLRWSALPRVAGQLVREHMRSERGETLPMEARVDGDDLVVRVDALSRDDRFLNDLRSEVTLAGPLADGSDSTQRQAPVVATVGLAQRAPGAYEARLPLERFGTFALDAVHRVGARIVARSHARVLRPYPAEFTQPKGGNDRLSEASRLTGGRAYTGPADVLDPGEEHLERQVPLWPNLVFSALFLWLCDLALRRLGLRFGAQRPT